MIKQHDLCNNTLSLCAPNTFRCVWIFGDSLPLLSWEDVNSEATFGELLEFPKVLLHNLEIKGNGAIFL